MTAEERKIVDSLIALYVKNYDPCRHISESEYLEAAKEAIIDISKILKERQCL